MNQSMRVRLAAHDLKIAEARRLRAIERGLQARPAAKAPKGRKPKRARVVVDEEPAEEEEAGDEAEAPARKRHLR